MRTKRPVIPYRLVYFVDMAETMYTEQAADVSRDFLLDSRVSTWHREVFEHKGNEQKTDNESHFRAARIILFGIRMPI
jgi:hypothetical protein